MAKDVIVRLSYGYTDMDEAIADDAEYKKDIPHLKSTLSEGEDGQIYVELSSRWRYEMVRYIEKFLGEFGAMASFVYDANIVQK